MTNKEINKPVKTINLTAPIIFVLAVAAAFLLGMSWKEIKGGKKSEPSSEPSVELKVEKKNQTPTPEVLGEELESTIGNFLVTEDEICQENDKPIIYMFGYSGCPHCTWEHPIFEKVVAKFGALIALHDNMDKMDKQEADGEIFQQYSQINQGEVPFLVLGCRYARVGSGERAGEAAEEKNLTALICKLTNGQPEKVCAEVEELIGQIKN